MKSKAKVKKSGSSSSRGKDYWFKAKRNGWGWGLPIKWQGWAFLIGFIAYTFGSTAWFIGEVEMMPESEGFIWQFFVYMLLQVAGIAAIFYVGYKKGPKPRWRRGGLHVDDDPDTPISRF